MNSDKTLLRLEIRQSIAMLAESYIKKSDAQITNKLLSMPEFKLARRVFTYYSVGRECDTRELIASALGEGRVLALPRVYGNGVMDFAQYGGKLVPGSLKIPEPDAGSQVLKPDECDIMIVPALCCDERLHRLGQGGGYYDRYLPEVKALKVAFCREKLLQKKLQNEWNDFPVDIVITEQRVLRAN